MGVLREGGSRRLPEFARLWQATAPVGSGQGVARAPEQILGLCLLLEGFTDGCQHSLGIARNELHWLHPLFPEILKGLVPAPALCIRGENLVLDEGLGARGHAAILGTLYNCCQEASREAG